LAVLTTLWSNLVEREYGVCSNWYYYEGTIAAVTVIVVGRIVFFLYAETAGGRTKDKPVSDVSASALPATQIQNLPKSKAATKSLHDEERRRSLIVALSKTDSLSNSF